MRRNDFCTKNTVPGSYTLRSSRSISSSSSTTAVVSLLECCAHTCGNTLQHDDRPASSDANTSHQPFLLKGWDSLFVAGAYDSSRCSRGRYNQHDIRSEEKCSCHGRQDRGFLATSLEVWRYSMTAAAVVLIVMCSRLAEYLTVLCAWCSNVCLVGENVRRATTRTYGVLRQKWKAHDF